MVLMGKQRRKHAWNLIEAFLEEDKAVCPTRDGRMGYLAYLFSEGPHPRHSATSLVKASHRERDWDTFQFRAATAATGIRLVQVGQQSVSPFSSLFFPQQPTTTTTAGIRSPKETKNNGTTALNSAVPLQRPPPRGRSQCAQVRPDGLQQRRGSEEGALHPQLCRQGHFGGSDGDGGRIQGRWHDGQYPRTSLSCCFAFEAGGFIVQWKS